MSRELLRTLPSVDAWLSSEQGRCLCAEYSHAEVVALMRSHLGRVRGQLIDGRTTVPALVSDEYTQLLRAELIAQRMASLRPLINATGIVIHTNLGRAPLAEEAILAIRDVAAGYSNLEYTLRTGERGSRQDHTERLLIELTGAEAALVVNNGAAAVLLALRALAGGGDVVVSRGELIEIGGSFRLPDVIAESGARLVEVGTTNRTSLNDYAGALTEQTRALLISHPSNFRIIGFTASAPPRELATLARENGLPLVHDLGSGSLVRLDSLPVAEPTVAECVAAGADVVTFSGDKLLGGPQAGIVVGRASYIERLKQHPLARAMRIDKLSLAALEATLKLYRSPQDPLARVPVLRMITESRESIARRSRAVARSLRKIMGVSATLADGISYAGGGSLPMSELATRVIRLAHDGSSAGQLAERLRAADPPVIGRVTQDAVTLDLRTVLPAQSRPLVESIRSVLS